LNNPAHLHGLWKTAFKEFDMTTDRVNTWLSLGANVGVIVGLLFLAFEINQSTKATIAAASEGLTEQSLNFLSLRLDNETVARATFKQESGQELDQFEKFQLEMLQHVNFRLFESAFLQYQRGFYEASEWARYQRIIAANFRSNEAAQRMWERTKGGWTEDFENEVEAIRQEEFTQH
jgi:hypothetical protein